MELLAFCLPKRGNSADEYEDASAGDPERGRFAVADGATESSFAGLWARLLVDGFVAAPIPQPSRWSDWLPPLQKRWLEEVANKELPWYAEAKLQDGAFATFLGLVIREKSGLLGKKKVWQAVAVGDGCFFQVRENRLYRAFPMHNSEDFGNTPWLVGSRNTSPKSLKKKEMRAKGDWLAGDRFWLMTDALAQWFLSRVEAGKQPWGDLDALVAEEESENRFAAWIDQQRDEKLLKNDDVTLLAISL